MGNSYCGTCGSYCHVCQNEKQKDFMAYCEICGTQTGNSDFGGSTNCDCQVPVCVFVGCCYSTRPEVYFSHSPTEMLAGLNKRFKKTAKSLAELRTLLQADDHGQGSLGWSLTVVPTKDPEDE